MAQHPVRSRPRLDSLFMELNFSQDGRVPHSLTLRRKGQETTIGTVAADVDDIGVAKILRDRIAIIRPDLVMIPCGPDMADQVQRQIARLYLELERVKIPRLSRPRPMGAVFRQVVLSGSKELRQ